MFKTLTKWWALPSATSLNDTLQKLQLQLLVEQAEKAKLQQQIDTLTHEDPIIPKFVLSSTGVDAIRGVQMDMDWNEAFIQYLKDNGSTGRYDEIHIQKFLVMLYQELINRLDQRLIDKKDVEQTGDFE